MTDIVSQLIVTGPLPSGDGYTWTLASQLGKMLRLAEERFGPRDCSYTILGVEFIDGVPQCWYPGNCRNVVIQLGLRCLREPDRACFQLAHEAIHLLSPSGGRNANVLEEGLAAHFQSWYMTHHYPSDWPRTGLDCNVFECLSYTRAKQLVDRLLDLQPEIIRNLRVDEPTLGRITRQMILANCPEVSEETADTLTAKFVRESNTEHPDVLDGSASHRHK